MQARNRIENRAQRIFDFLRGHLGDGFTIGELCRALKITDGPTTRNAIGRARDLATIEGLHFPPAVPHGGFKYMVTDRPGDALDPALHMARIESGVAARKDDGLNFMEGKLREMDPADRPVASVLLRMEKRKRKAVAEFEHSMTEAIAELVQLRRE